MISLQDRLESYIKSSDMIYIDACSLRHKGMPKFYDNVKHILERENKKIICPQKVWEEIRKYISGNSLEEEECLRAQKYWQKMFIRRILEPKKAESYEISHADHCIKADFYKHYVTNRMLLITNDRDLAFDILSINNDRSTHSKYKIHAAFISDDGYLVPIMPTERKKVPEEEKFPLGKQPQTDEPYCPTVVPQEGNIVCTKIYRKGSQLHLIKKIGNGGEGDIYLTDAGNCVAKIFKQEYCTRNRYEKLQLMLSKPIAYDGICWPLDILTNECGEFVGYLMLQAKGDSLRKVLMKRWLTNNKWERKELIALCLNILDKLTYLQERNVITVDYNPNNILVQPNGDTWLVDTDSCQVGCYPAVVDTKDFTPPEIYRRRETGENVMLFSHENINFSTAVLIFKILIPGQHPLHDVQAEARTVKDDILTGIFPYRLGEERRSKPPKGVWQKCWSHLPYKLKKALWNTFQRDGKNYAPNMRYDARQWQNLMKAYQRDIDKMSETDINSLAAFPATFKKVEGVEYGYCKNCKREEPQEWLEQRGGFCEECANEIVDEYKCSRCGKSMGRTRFDIYVKNYNRLNFCPDCYEKRQQIYKKAECIDCGDIFEITIGEKEDFAEKEWPLPKRCPECRNQKREYFE